VKTGRRFWDWGLLGICLKIADIFIFGSNPSESSSFHFKLGLARKYFEMVIGLLSKCCLRTWTNSPISTWILIIFLQGLFSFWARLRRFWIGRFGKIPNCSYDNCQGLATSCNLYYKSFCYVKMCCLLIFLWKLSQKIVVGRFS